MKRFAEDLPSSDTASWHNFVDQETNQQPGCVDENNSKSCSKQEPDQSPQPQDLRGKQGSIVKRWLARRKRKRNDSGKLEGDFEDHETTEDPQARPLPKKSQAMISGRNDDTNSLQELNSRTTQHGFDCDRGGLPQKLHAEEPPLKNYLSSNTPTTSAQSQNESIRTKEALSSHHSDTTDVHCCRTELPLSSPSLKSHTKSPPTESTHQLSVKSSASPPVPGNFFYTQATQLSQESPPLPHPIRKPELTPPVTSKRAKLAPQQDPTAQATSKAITIAQGAHKVNSLDPPSNQTVPNNAVHWMKPVQGGFRTAGQGDKVKVSAKQLQRMSNLLDQSPKRPHSAAVGIPRGNIQTLQSTEPSTLSGFRMAGSGKDLTVKQETLQRAISLFDGGIDSTLTRRSDGHRAETHHETLPTSNSIRTTTAPKHGFCTAGSGAIVSVSEESMKRVGSLFSSNTEAKIHRRKTLGESHVPHVLQENSDTSDGTAAQHKEIDSLDPSLDQTVPKHSDHLSFRTAGLGSEVKVSAERLQRMSNLFDQSPKRAHSATGDIGIAAARGNLETLTEAKSLSGFRMAGSGKDLTVKKETFQRAISLFDSSNDSARASCSTGNSIRPTKASERGFCTAGSGATVSVSEECMKRVGTLFSSNNDEAIHRRLTLSHTEHKSGLYANDKQQDETLRPRNESKTFIDGGSGDDDMSHSCSSFLGFRSAGKGTAVAIEEKHLQRANHLLGGVEDDGKDANVETTQIGLSFGTSIGTNDRSQSKSQLHAAFATSGKGAQVVVAGESLQRITNLNLRNEVHADKVNFDSVVNECDCQNDSFDVTVDVLNSQTGNKQLEADSRLLISETDLPTSFTGFKTAGEGTVVKLENSSIHKYQSLYDDPNATEGSESHLNASSTHPHNQQPGDDWLHQSKIVGYSGSSTKTPGSMNILPLQCNDGMVACKEVFHPMPLVTPGARHKTVLPLSQRSHELFKHGSRVSRDSAATPATILGSITPSQNPRHPFVTPGWSNEKGAEPASTTPGSIGHEGGNGLSLTPSKPIPLSNNNSFLAAYKGGSFTNTDDLATFGISECVLQVSSENSPSLRFFAHNGLPSGFHEDTEKRNNPDQIGALCDYLQAMRELRPVKALEISERWIKNHTRWIIWKLASMERRFAEHLNGHLTFSLVVRHLDLRFNKEYLEGKRSPLRKIVNRDVSAASMMILCVARIFQKGPSPNCSNRKNTYGIEITDGWYSLRAEIDASLSSYIEKRLISVGTKLAVSNASLTGFNEGIDHLDDSFDVMDPDRSPYLSIRGNGCRIARWNARLGFVSPQKFQNEFGLLSVKRIRDVLVDGGPIPQIEVSVVDCDPVKYLARTEGECKVWTEAEAAARIEEREKAREKLIDQFRQEVEKQCEDEVDENSPELWVKMHAANDPDVFFHELSHADRKEILDWRAKRSASIQKRMQEEIEARLEEADACICETTPFLRCILRSAVADEIDSDGKDANLDEEAVLTVWKPTEDQISMLRKGSFVCLRKVGVQPHLFNGRKQFQAHRETAIDYAHFSDPILIQANNSDAAYSSLLEIHMLGRSLTSVAEQDFSRPLGFIGYVIGIRQTSSGLILWLTDESQLLARIIVDTTEVQNTYSAHSLVEFAANSLSRNSFAIIGFERFILREFDCSMQCPILYGQFSRISWRPEGSRANRLKRLLLEQKQIEALKRAASLADLGIPPLSNGEILVGFISDFFLVTSHQLQLTVDVGSELMRTALVPLEVLLEVENTVEAKFIDSPVAFVDDKGGVLDQLRSLRWLYRCRHSLFTLTLKFRTDSSSMAEVVSMKPLDQGVLTELYSVARRNRLS